MTIHRWTKAEYSERSNHFSVEQSISIFDNNNASEFGTIHCVRRISCKMNNSFFLTSKKSTNLTNFRFILNFLSTGCSDDNCIRKHVTSEWTHSLCNFYEPTPIEISYCIDKGIREKLLGRLCTTTKRTSDTKSYRLSITYT